MNNQKILKDLNQELDSSERVKMEMGLSQGLQILGAIRALKENEHYWAFKKFVLDPSIDIVEKRIERNIKELATNESLKNVIFQDQGMLAAFKKFSDFDELEKLYLNQTAQLSSKLKK